MTVDNSFDMWPAIKTLFFFNYPPLVVHDPFWNTVLKSTFDSQEHELSHVSTLQNSSKFIIVCIQPEFYRPLISSTPSVLCICASIFAAIHTFTCHSFAFPRKNGYWSRSDPFFWDLFRNCGKSISCFKWCFFSIHGSHLEHGFDKQTFVDQVCLCQILCLGLLKLLFIWVCLKMSGLSFFWFPII